MRFVWATGSDVGLARSANEDSVYPKNGGSGEGPLLIAVADGMGGHVAGEIASSTALRAALRARGSVADRIEAANEAVLDAGRDDPTLLGMGTTLTLAEIDSDGLVRIGHIGDSRAYLLRNDILEMITTDHTVVQQLVDGGYLTPEQASRHPQRNIITRAIGMPGPAGPDEYEVMLRSGDVLMVCSDGLNAGVDDATIHHLLAGAESPEAAVWALIEAANDAGGIDNITVAVVAAG
jgi:protein phosphatase